MTFETKLNRARTQAQGNDPTTRTSRAYEAGAEMTRERMRRDAPDDAEALRAVESSDVVVVSGCYDHLEQVLGALGLPFTKISPEALDRVALRPEQLLAVNCPGQVSAGAVLRVRDFVAAGGSLFTTDWALHHLVAPAFPGVIDWNGTKSRDDVVRIEVRSKDNPFLQGVLDGEDDPQWWLEGASYPIRVLDPSRVEVLLASRDLETRYGEAPVAVLFRHGEGEVFHMISHYYLQRTELRTARHRSTSADYFQEKGVAFTLAMREKTSDLSLGEIESASSSTRFLANLVARKKRKASEVPKLQSDEERPS